MMIPDSLNKLSLFPPTINKDDRCWQFSLIASHGMWIATYRAEYDGLEHVLSDCYCVSMHIQVAVEEMYEFLVANGYISGQRIEVTCAPED